MSCGIFVCGPLQLMFFCYQELHKKKSTVLKFHCRQAHSSLCTDPPPLSKNRRRAVCDSPSIIEYGKILHKLKKFDWWKAGYAHRLAHSRHSPNNGKTESARGTMGRGKSCVKGTLFIKGEALPTIFAHQRMIEWYLFHENRVKVPQKKTTRHVSDLHSAAIVTINKRHLILPMLL